MINLWLCEHFDLQLIAELSKQKSVNVPVHARALSKCMASHRSPFVSPMHWLDESALQKYSIEKSNWARRSKVKTLNSLRDLCTDRNKFSIDPEFARVIEVLFSPCNQGCLDAIAFAQSLLKAQDGVEAELRVIVGGNYTLTELAGLVWWLAVCKWFFSKSHMDFVWVDRRARAVHVQTLDELLSLLSTNHSTSPLFNGLIPEQIRKGEEPACLAWVGALRHPRGWDPEIYRLYGKEIQILRVAEQNASFFHEAPCVELSAGNGMPRESLYKLFQCAESVLSEAWELPNNDDFIISDRLGIAIEQYFLGGISPLVLHRIEQTIECIEQHIGTINLKYFYSTACPFIESIALHEWARRRNVLPTLLPHSFTAIHEFPAATYKAALTFVRSDYIMPSVHDDPGALAKEKVVSQEEIRLQNSSRASSKNIIVEKKFEQLKFLLCFPFQQRWRISLEYAKKVISEPYIRWRFKKRMRVTNLKIGYLLNYEHFELNAGLNFEQLFDFVLGIASKVEACTSKNDVVLALRRKVGWTNVGLLEWHSRLSQGDTRAKNLLISPDRMSLEEFGVMCDLVLYFQGTSAVPELMSLGVPVVYLNEENAPALLDQPYVVMPEEIVPKMNIKSIMERIDREPEWLEGLSRLQREWIATQMAPSGS